MVVGLDVGLDVGVKVGVVAGDVADDGVGVVDDVEVAGAVKLPIFKMRRAE